MSYFRKMMSSDNTASYGRFASLLSLCFVMAAMAFLMWQNKSALPEIPTSWQAIILVPFGMSKGLDTLKSFFSKDEAIPEAK